MRRPLGLALLSLLSTLPPLGGHAGPVEPAARVQVVRPQPGAIRDAGWSADRNALLGDLARYLERAARPCIPEGSTLTVHILAVDMAGRFERWRGPQLANVRIIRNVYSPRIELWFEVVGADGRVTDGRRTLLDPSGALLGTPDLPADPLRYEKLLLAAWLEREFGSTVSRF